MTVCGYSRLVGFTLFAAGLVFTAGCKLPTDSPDSGEVFDSGNSVLDAGANADAGSAPDAGMSADAGLMCLAPEQRCGDVCADLSSDSAHCGACGTHCAISEECVGSSCAPVCTGDLSKCGNTCLDLLHDRTNCGRCGHTCASAEMCTAGTCGSPTNYYFSSSMGDDSRTSTQAQNPATPWKTIAKLNAYFGSLNPGDYVLFKRGEVFTGTIRVTASGTAALPIVLGAYGQGVAPVISGFQTLTGSWTQEAAGVYSKAVTPESAPNIVTLDGVSVAMGRFPQTGWLTYETHSANTSITDAQLAASPSWAGAEVVIRKNRWMLDRSVVSTHTGGTLNYAGASTWGPTDGYGYFFQNDLKCLTYPGAWQFKSGRIFMYFGNTDPTSKQVRVSVTDRLVDISQEHDVTLEGLRLEGANTYALQNTSSRNITIRHCELSFSGRDGIYVDNMISTNAYMVIDGNVFTNNNECAINIRGNNPAWIKNNTISDTGMLPGSGTNSDNTYDAIAVYGPNTIIEFNSITNSGHSAISIRTNDGIEVRNNFIRHFGMTRYDAGGVYSWNANATSMGRVITHNIILDSNQVSEGIGGDTNLALYGIYLDENTTNTRVASNTVAHCQGAGIHNLNAGNNTLESNTCFDNGRQLSLVHAWNYGMDITGMAINNNVFVSKTGMQSTLYFRDDSNPFSAFGTADHNDYARPIDDTGTIVTSVNAVDRTRTLAEWQALSGQDVHSRRSPIAISTASDLLFEYNATTANTTVPLVGTYAKTDGTVVSGPTVLAPYSSIVLIKK